MRARLRVSSAPCRSSQNHRPMSRHLHIALAGFVALCLNPAFAKVEVEAAQQNIVKQVRRLEAEGRIVIAGSGGEVLV